MQVFALYSKRTPQEPYWDGLWFESATLKPGYANALEALTTNALGGWGIQ
jgi:hypothetical protein